jgi:hypothetical protein
MRQAFSLSTAFTGFALILTACPSAHADQLSEAHYKALLQQATGCVMLTAADYGRRTSESAETIARAAMSHCRRETESVISDRERAYNDFTSGIPRAAYERNWFNDAIEAVVGARASR